MNSRSLGRIFWLICFGMILMLTSGCASLLPAPAPLSTFYSLDSETGVVPGAPLTPTIALVSSTLLVSPPHAAAGFDSQRIIYVREPHKLEYFARSEWVDTPARMLLPLILDAVSKNGAFHAVLPTSSAANGELRLDTELIRLQQNFDRQPSSVRFTLRVSILDNATREVIASHEFDETIVAPTDDPYGGVIAANRVVQNVLRSVALFCTEIARARQAPCASAPIC